MTYKVPKSLVGACGVFHAAAELSRRGWIAMPTIRNTEGIDIVAVRSGKTANIQVKTNSYGKARFPMRTKNETLVAPNIFYILVTLKDEGKRPDFYVVPSKIVAEYIKQAHQIFVNLPPKVKLERHKGKSIKEIRKKSTMRLFPVTRNDVLGKMPEKLRSIKIEDYKDKWEILEG